MCALTKMPCVAIWISVAIWMPVAVRISPLKVHRTVGVVTHRVQGVRSLIVELVWIVSYRAWKRNSAFRICLTRAT
jgi:hypothetical protein